MINLTKLNGDPFVLNAELIKTVEETPDTVITTTTGHKFIVQEKADEVVKKTVEYKKSIFMNFMK